MVGTFNGAAAAKPRKPESLVRRDAECRPFNGAAAAKPRKLGVQAEAGGTAVHLQWSRGCEAAEARILSVALEYSRRPFNGAAAAKPRKRG